MWWIPVVIILGLGLIAFVFAMFFSSEQIFKNVLHRITPDTWPRGVSIQEERQIKMHNIGQEWYAENKQYDRRVTIENDGLKLVAEYFDFGFDKCAIMLPGRMESCEYSYYFSKPFKESGYNVLCIDPRANGLSEGEFNTVGFKESGDNIAWARYAHDVLGNKTVVFYGLCIGAQGGIFAANRKDTPPYISALICEGVFTDFYHMMINQLKFRKKPAWPTLHFFAIVVFKYTGINIYHGPKNVLPRSKTPILMIHSKEDIFSDPSMAAKLFESCPAENKQIVWFEHGAHSHLRLEDTEKYDKAIKEFLRGI